MNLLIAALRKNRELKVAVGKFTFTCRRPTDEEAVTLYRGGLSNAVIAANHVVAWDGVTEDDLVGGGGTDAVPFDGPLWREWCADRNDFWAPIGDACMKAYEDHVSGLKEAEKNS